MASEGADWVSAGMGLSESAEIDAWWTALAAVRANAGGDVEGASLMLVRLPQEQWGSCITLMGTMVADALRWDGSAEEFFEMWRQRIQRKADDEL